ncbi:unnamed protein product [Parajaminaea phylloscopi]
MPLVEPDGLPPRSQHAASASLSPQDEGPDPLPSDAVPDQTQAYNAWSASIGGQSAEEWLGFEEWRTRYLADKERVETARRAEERQRKAKHKAQVPQQRSKAETDGNAGKQTRSDVLRDAQEHRGASHNDHEQQTEDGRSTSNASLTAQHAKTGPLVGDSMTQRRERADFEAGTQSESAAAASISSDESQTSWAPSQSTDRVPPSQSLPSKAHATFSTSMPSVGSEIHQAARPALKEPAASLKDLKHRWNFASTDCAAVIHRTNPSAKFASAILSGKKDRYMLSPCPGASKDTKEVFVVVELCDEISIDTIVMANHEFFSRMFKRFKVSVAPALQGAASKDSEDWTELGVYRARNVRGPQVFNIVTPSTGFYRYVRIDFLEYYGHEYYCPLSIFKVYGLTQLDHFRRQEEEDRRAAESPHLLSIGEGQDEDADSDFIDEELIFELPDEIQTVPETGTWEAVWEGTVPFSSVLPADSEGDPSTPSDAANASLDDADEIAPVANETLEQQSPRSPTDEPSMVPSWSPGETLPVTAIDPKMAEQMNQSTPDPPSVRATQERPPPESVGVCAAPDFGRNDMFQGLEPTDVCRKSTKLSTSAQQAGQTVQTTAPSLTSQRKSAATTVSHSSMSSSMTSSAPPLAAHKREPSSGHGEHSWQPVAASSIHSNGGSESIYRTITKRLSALESNATLSMQYIEHSGQMLREVFRAMERRQETRLGEMLRALNSSNWRQIETLKRRQQLDLQKAIFEFDVHRQQTEAERRALLVEVQHLASEVMFERKLGVVQLILVLSLFGFMIMTRGPAQSMVHASMNRWASVPSRRHVPRLFTEHKRSDLQSRYATASASEEASLDADALDHVRETTPSLDDTPRRTVAQALNGLSSGDENKMVTVDEDKAVRGPDTGGQARELPKGDFAEMSPSELRDYLGFTSPRSDRAQSPVGPDLSFADETGDEGLETAIEDIESTAEGQSDFEDALLDDENQFVGLLDDPRALQKTTIGRLSRRLTPTPDAVRGQCPSPASPVGTGARSGSHTEPSGKQRVASAPASDVPRLHVTPVKISTRPADRSTPISPARASPLRPRSACSMDAAPPQYPDSDESADEDGRRHPHILPPRDPLDFEDADERPWQKVVSRRVLNSSSPAGRPRPKSLLSPNSRRGSEAIGTENSYPARKRDAQRRWSVSPRFSPSSLPDSSPSLKMMGTRDHTASNIRGSSPSPAAAFAPKHTHEQRAARYHSTDLVPSGPPSPSPTVSPVRRWPHAVSHSRPSGETQTLGAEHHDTITRSTVTAVSSPKTMPSATDRFRSRPSDGGDMARTPSSGTIRTSAF